MSKPSPHPPLPSPTGRRWWRGLFCKTFVGMLAATWLGTLLLSYAAVLEARHTQQRTTAAPLLLERLQREGAALPLDSRQPQCQLLLAALLGRALQGAGGLLQYSASSAEGRLALRYRDAGGSTCQYPEHLTAPLAQALALAEQRLGDQPSLQLTLQPDSGWLNVAALRPTSGGSLSLGLHANDSWQSFLAQGRGQWSDLSLYLLVISAIPAFAVAWFLLRRIRRAERVAEAWAGGDLRQRIGDRGQDEFGRLGQRFDLMADALARQLAVSQALAAAEERNRLARDLHDTAKQRSFALGLQLSVLRQMPADDPARTQRLDSALALTAQLQHDLAEVIQRFSAPTIAELGLRRALGDGLALLLQGSGIELALQFDAAAERRLGAHPALARELLMIATEAAANALRHSGATRLAVELCDQGERLLWRIADNGRGFAMQAAAAGMGLTNMRQRAHALPAGHFELASTAAGCTVSVSFREEQG